MNDFILDGFKSEIEKISFIATVGRRILKPAAKMLWRNKMNTAIGGMGIHHGLQRTKKTLPKMTRVVGS